MEKYYNALNIIYKCSYPKLKKTWDRFQNWEGAWKEEKTNRPDPEEEWKKLGDLGIDLILQNDPRYPRFLKEIPLAPFGIYVLGDLNYSEPAVAIVGTRAATPQGKELAKNFADKLSSAGITIISGLALGIDECAHRGAVENNKKTIAVLGTPIDYIYPRQNQKLAEKILETGGAIISEFPIGQKYLPSNFLARNRIISGLSNGILIIEAPERSGSLATARFALDQNREIFVIPGNITSKNYQGSNGLIKAGANLVTDPKDILDFFNIAAEDISPSINNLAREEIKIIQALRGANEKLSAERLIVETDLDIGQLNKSLATLTIKGIIKEMNGKYYI